MARLVLRFASSPGGVSLASTEFVSPGSGEYRSCCRGQSGGERLGGGVFRWSQAVRALADLMIRHRISAVGANCGSRGCLAGKRGSLASSLDFAITKQSQWLLDMFGVDSDGIPVIRRLVRRVNTERKRPGPVVLSVFENTLPAEALDIYLDDDLVTSPQALEALLRSVEGSEVGGTVPTQSVTRGGADRFQGTDQLEIEVFSFIPMYLGEHGIAADRQSSTGLSSVWRDDHEVFLFDDGFCVALLRRKFHCGGVLDFLSARRVHHLELLGPESRSGVLMRELRGPARHEFLFPPPAGVPYVMSAHAFSNGGALVSPTQLLLMVEPSIVGITDEPLQVPDEEHARSAVQLVGTGVGSLASGVRQFSGGGTSFFATWANVLAVGLGDSVRGLDGLIELEVRLQRLWYALFLCSGSLIEFSRVRSMTSGQHAAIAGVCDAFTREYKRFCAIRPPAAKESDELRRVLIETSRLPEVFGAFEREVARLDLMEPSEELQYALNSRLKSRPHRDRSAGGGRLRTDS